MGLKGDLTEITDVWHQAPWRVRVFLLVSGFLATSSLASLAESVAKWKGFLLTGVSFYQDYFQLPIHAWLGSWLPWRITPTWIDALTVLAITLTAISRRQIHRYKSSPFPQVKRQSLITLALFFALPFLFIIAANPPENKIDKALFAFAMSNHIGLLFLALMPPRQAGDMLLLIYLALPPLIVSTLAAVNLGIQ